MKCEKCQAENSDSANLCIECGAELLNLYKIRKELFSIPHQAHSTVNLTWSYSELKIKASSELNQQPSDHDIIHHTAFDVHADLDPGILTRRTHVVFFIGSG